MPSPEPLRVEGGATSSLLAPGTGRSSNSCALQRSPRRFAPRAPGVASFVDLAAQRIQANALPSLP